MKKTKPYLFYLLAFALMLFLPATITQAASRQQPGYVSNVTARVSATSASVGNKVTVTWKKASNATAYRVYYKQAGGKWRAIANVSGTKYTHTASSKYPLAAGKKYSYTVRAYNKYSRKWGSYDTKGKTVTIPAVPGTVKVNSVKAKSYREVSVNWSKVSNVTSYYVYYKEYGVKSWKKIATVNNRTTSFTHRSSTASPLKAGKKYTYTVRAYNGTFKKWGGYNTKGVTVTVPKKPVAKPTAAPTAAPNPTVTPQPTKVPEPTQIPTATPTVTPTATPRPTEPVGNEKAEEYAKEVIRLTNIERKKEGLSELKYHEKLQQAAMVRAKELVQKYSHTRPDGRNCDTAVFEAGAANPIAENAGAGRTTPQGIVDAWMNSAGHKTSIMDPHSTHIGAGYYCDSDGTGYWIQVFAKNPDAKCTLTVDGNGGTFPSKGVEKYSMELPQGMTLYTKDFEEPIKAGCLFEKWTTVLSFGWESGATDEIHMSDDKILKANWINADSSESSQSLFTNNTSPSITDDLFSDGTIAKTGEIISDSTLDDQIEDIIEIDETNDISDPNDITFADNDSTDLP